MAVRRFAALMAAAGLVALSGGPALAVTKPTVKHSVSTPPTRPAASCSQVTVDGAGVLGGPGLQMLRRDDAELAASTTLRIRTVTSVPGGDLNAYEKRLQISCGWASAANLRRPRLLVVMVSTEDRQMGIYPGPDLTGVLTHDVWLTIEQEAMRPYLADEKWAEGMDAGVVALDKALSGQSTAGQSPSALPSKPSFSDDANGGLPGSRSASPDSGFGSGGLAFGALMLLAVVSIIARITRRSRRRRQGRWDPTTGLWDPTFGQHTERHGSNGHHHGGFGGGGFGAGGFDSGGGGSSSDGGGGSSGF